MIDANGRKVLSQANASGAYWFSYAGREFPLLVKATDTQGTGGSWVAVVASAPVDAASATVHLNPLTSAQAALLTTEGRLDELSVVGVGRDLITSASVAQATAKLQAVLAPTLRLEGVDPASFDPRSSATKLDLLTADIRVNTQGATTLAVNGLSAPTAERALNTSASAAAVTPPPVSASYLATVKQQLGACVSALVPLNCAVSAALPVTGTLATGVTLGQATTDRFSTLGNGRLMATVRVPYLSLVGRNGAYVVNVVQAGTATSSTDTTSMAWQVVSVGE
ncbi:MAG: hypothetical protein JO142_16675 [Burkholderiales bacterium]|nr:hypothetical protein [Burkholderiales bacterium]